MAKKILTQAAYDVDNIQNQADQVKGQATALKTAFDKTGSDAKIYNNSTLLSELASEIANDSGANAIGSEGVFNSATNVGDELKGAKEQIDGLVVGMVPPGTPSYFLRTNAAGTDVEWAPTSDWVRPVTDNKIAIDELAVNAGISSIVGPDGQTYYDYPDSGKQYTAGTIDHTKAYCATVTTSTDNVSVSSMINGVIGDFKVGQEITLQDATSKEDLIIQSIADPLITFTTNIVNTYASGANCYRSNVVVNGEVWGFGNVGKPQTDEFTKSLLHFNGLDTSTTFTDETGKVWTPNGGAQLDTSVKKFGTASGLFGGSGDYIDTPDSDDFNFGTDDFTIDFQMQRNGNDGVQQRMCGQSDGSASGTSINAYFEANGSNQISVQMNDAVPSSKSVKTTTPVTTDGLMHHIALVRNNNNLMIFLDGLLEDTLDVTGVTFLDSSNKFSIGRLGELATNTYKGWIDEFRVSKGIARWTANFTPPTAEYVYEIGSETEVTDIDIRVNIEARVDKTEISAFLETNDFDTVTLDGSLSIHASGSNEVYVDTTDVKVDEGTNNMYMSVGSVVTADEDITMKYELTRASIGDAVEIKRVQGGVF